MNHLQVKGFVLSAIRSGEADRLLRLLTADHGLLTVMARGASRIKSPLSSLSSPFVLIEANLFVYRDRHTLDSATLIEGFLPLREDLTRLTCASHLAQVFQDVLWEGLISPDVYALWAYTLHALSTQDDPFLAAHLAQVRLLALIGFAPWLDDCLSCHRPNTQPALFSFPRSGMLCERCRTTDDRRMQLSAGAVACLCHVLTAPLNRLFQVKLDEHVRAEVLRFSTLYLTEKMEKAYERLSLLQSLENFSLESQDSRPQK